MAKIIENKKGRRLIRLNTSDVLDVVREYQRIVSGSKDYLEIREKINDVEFYLPEDVV